jgi:hypothetical protein
MMTMTVEQLNDAVRNNYIQIVTDLSRGVKPGQVVKILHNTGKEEVVKIKNSVPFSNGRAKAETYLNQKMKDAGMKVVNARILDTRPGPNGFMLHQLDDGNWYVYKQGRRIAGPFTDMDGASRAAKKQ